jgi:hypothetical protein
MCPVCIATAAIIAGSATGTGGLTALVVGKFRKRRLASKFHEQTEAEEVHDGNDGDRGASESCVAR